MSQPKRTQRLSVSNASMSGELSGVTKTIYRQVETPPCPNWLDLGGPRPPFIWLPERRGEPKYYQIYSDPTFEFQFISHKHVFHQVIMGEATSIVLLNHRY